MQRGADGVVRPAREQVTGVDDDGTLDGGRVDELTAGALDLQSPGRVLEEQRDRAVVGVLAGTHLVRVPEEDILLHLRVVQQTERVVADIDKVVKELTRLMSLKY